MTFPLIFYIASAVSILAAAANFILNHDGIAIGCLTVGIVIFGFAEYWDTK